MSTGRAQTAVRRILVVTADYPPIEGGISTVCTEFARELAARGFEVTVLAPWFRKMTEFDRDEPVSVVRYRGYGLGWFRAIPIGLRALPMAGRHDAVVAINISYGGMMGMLGRVLLRKPYITFAYAYEFLKFRHTPVIGPLLRAAYRRSDAVVAISSYTRQNLETFGVPGERIATVLPGARIVEPVLEDDVARIRTKYALGDGPIILSVGRLIARKRQVALVTALARVRTSHPDAVLLIAGRGPCVSEISRRAVELGQREHVVLPGYVSDADLQALYAACTVFALPAGEGDGGHVEGFGLVFTEAHSHGKPVVGGRSGGVPDAVRDGDTGILVEPGDDDGLAEALCSLLREPEKARAMGERGRQRIAGELNWRVFTDGVLQAARWERG